MKGLLLMLGIAACSGCKSETSWKLYKDPEFENPPTELHLMLDMRHLAFEKENCEKLRSFYTQDSPGSTYYCMLNDSQDSVLAIPKWDRGYRNETRTN